MVETNNFFSTSVSIKSFWITLKFNLQNNDVRQKYLIAIKSFNS